jgi:hypothetical protein
MLADAPTIVCRNCGETWPTDQGGLPSRRPDRARQSEPARPAVDARRQPLVTYSGAADSAWAAKVERDVLPAAEPRRSRVGTATAALASLLFIAAFFGGREAAVAALPDLAGLYDSIGLPVNLDGLEIRAVQAERPASGAPGKVSVRGEIVNTGRADLPVPALQVSFGDDATAAAGSRGFDAPGRTLKRGESAPFTLELDDVPENASTVVLRFRRAAEAGAAVSAPTLRGSTQ